MEMSTHPPRSGEAVAPPPALGTHSGAEVAVSGTLPELPHPTVLEAELGQWGLTPKQGVCGAAYCPEQLSARRRDVMAARLQRDLRDPRWWPPMLSAVLPRAWLARLRRDTKDKEGCPPGMEVLEVDEMLVFYSERELQGCVDAALLAEQLGRVDAIPFTYEQLTVFKRKLDKTYPQRYPANVVQRLGSLFLLVSPEDIGKWDVTSTETLKALLQVSRGQKADAQAPQQLLPQVAALIARYVACGVQVDEDTLATVATLSPAYLCLLSPEQLEFLQPNILWEVEPRTLEGCPLPQMEVLYTKAQVAFQNGTGPSYLERIQPYLGGATTKHLRALSRQNISMDVAVFKELWTEAVLPLTVAEVRGLLGPHVVDLKVEERNSPVWDWIVRQRQEDLDTLGLGLQGGIPNGYLVVDLGAQEALLGPCIPGPGSVLASLLSLLLASASSCAALYASPRTRWSPACHEQAGRDFKGPVPKPPAEMCVGPQGLGPGRGSLCSIPPPASPEQRDTGGERT
ncbi:mesothelin [Trichechus manatus latirostris]|uniref:Mesothelin n=1 Tax=Trichechus manatus latirostris TaxID=127582 RepID=A0A2Y9DF54_TRIMA|nr:mesothelin [Trichechus manatus latirostris]